MPEIKVTSSVEKQTKFGKPMKALEVFVDNEVRKVNVFSNAPDFANIHQGSIILGTMSKKGDYWDIAFDGITPRVGNGGAFKQKIIEDTMQRKETSIGKFQDNKEFSIMVASTMSGAVALACAEYKDKTILDTLDQAVLKWRQFLLDNWEVNPKDILPFKDNNIPDFPY